MNDIFVFDIARLGVKSILSTAAVYPKPGLVTPLDSLSLNDTEDVDFQAMIDCAMALFPCFINCASIGNDTERLLPTDVLALLNPVEMQGLHEVNDVAQNKKGLKFHSLIFLLGLLCAAAGRLSAQARNLTPKALGLTASSFVRGSANNNNPMSLSILDAEDEKESRYALYGIDGCLGEAERGFPLTLSSVELINQLAHAATKSNSESVPTLCSLKSSRERAAHAFLRILSQNPDASLAGTSGIEGLAFVQETAHKALTAGGMTTSQGRDIVTKMDSELRTRKIIPRGSEAILSATLFMLDLGKLCPPRLPLDTSPEY